MRYASGVIIGRELVGSEEWAVYAGENELIAVDGVLRLLDSNGVRRPSRFVPVCV